MEEKLKCFSCFKNVTKIGVTCGVSSCLLQIATDVAKAGAIDRLRRRCSHVLHLTRWGAAPFWRVAETADGCVGCRRCVPRGCYSQALWFFLQVVGFRRFDVVAFIVLIVVDIFDFQWNGQVDRPLKGAFWGVEFCHRDRLSVLLQVIVFTRCAVVRR